MIKQEKLEDRLEETLETLLSEIYHEENIQSGDISPVQNIRWENLKEQFATLFLELIEQNKYS